MAAQQRARRRIEKYELSLGRQAAPLDEEGPVRQGVRRIDEEKVVVAPICRPCQGNASDAPSQPSRSEEHTYELQSLMRTSYAVFCMKKKKILIYTHQQTQQIH